MRSWLQHIEDLESRVVAWAVALSVALSIAATYAAPSDPHVGAAPAARLGSPAPAFAIKRLDGAETINLVQLRGKPLVLNFWATWCPPCRAEMPELDALSRERTDITVLAVDVQEDAAEVDHFRTALSLNLPIALDLDGRVWATYQSRGLPTTYLIDTDGIIRDIHVGPLTRELVETGLERLK
jgi:cytochrome c biogenesis protein CcmG, thiol:disulfide interchange protein DsbE